MAGRPSIYTDDLATQICREIAEGKSLRSICRREEMPDISTVLEWVIDGRHESFSKQYANARQIQAETLADELFDIADDGANDWIENNDPENPGYRVNGEHVQRSRLRLDTRKWYMSKVLPRFKEKEQAPMEDLAAAMLALAQKLPG